jgi:hypothetical protein
MGGYQRKKEKIMTDRIRDMLNYDALAEAEDITGMKLDDSPITQAIGFKNFIDHNQKKRSMLKSMKDTHFNILLDEYLEIVEEEGFIEILAETFTAKKRSWDDEDREDTYYVYYHPLDGILLAFDSYTWNKGEEPQINGGKFLYNWMPNLDDTGKPYKEAWSTTSSGGYNKIDQDGDAKWNNMMWCGDHDCREAIRYNISQLRKYGTFVKPWKFKPFLWLLNYDEVHKSKDYADAIRGGYTEESYYLEVMGGRRLNRVIKGIKEKTGQSLFADDIRRG